jgi:hypothetical protein
MYVVLQWNFEKKGSGRFSAIKAIAMLRLFSLEKKKQQKTDQQVTISPLCLVLDALSTSK